tara:strand:- start:1037 stop:1765 length:729 start_codon:yes stop_codon:yes gene_type:complete
VKILVVGETCTDKYIYGRAERLSPDAPVPVLVPERHTTTFGMASNVAKNLGSLGAEVTTITNSSSLVKTRYVDDKTNHMFMRLDEGEDDVPPCDTLSSVVFCDYDAVIISDYCKGFLSKYDISYICENHPLVFVDTKKIIGAFCDSAFIIKINELEWENSKNYYPPSLSNKLVITLGKRGCNYKGKNYPVEDVPVKDQTGAGDTFLAGLCFSYVKTKSMHKAISFANECAGKVVKTRGVTSI